MNREKKYFAAQESEDCAAKVIDKIDNWHNTLEAMGYMNKLEDMYAAYHGAYFTSIGEAHQITFGGDQGELTELVINHLRNIGEHMKNMTTATRPALEARAVNTDYKSLSQVGLANGLLDYYLREKKLEEYLIDAVEQAIVLGSGFVKLGWNPNIGDIINQDDIDEANEINAEADEMGEDGVTVPDPKKSGDLVFTTLSPVDVIMDLTKEGRDHDWIVCRSYKNRFDLIAQYPEYEEEIRAVDSKDNIDRIRISVSAKDETDDIPIYEFYHARTPSVPEGRYMLFVSSDAVLYDGELPYRHIPVYPIYPGKILGTPLGYSTLFDVLPIQDAMNSLYSAVLSNQNAFAVQNILNPSGSNIDINQISGSLNIIDYNPTSMGGKPEALQLLSTPPEVFNFLQMLNQAAETISAMNSVVRGNPEANLRSANAIALIQANAIQFMSGLQRSYVQLLENVGLGIIEILQDFADTKRVASIVGVAGKQYLKEFKGDDLNAINRVYVDTANPLTKCLEKGTKVLMYDGSRKNVEDIKVNEQVMGPDSKPRTVFVTGSGKEMMYKIRSKDKKRKVEYGTNESHILTLRYCSNDKNHGFEKGKEIDITVKDFLALPKYHQNVLQGFKVGVEFPEKELPISPYILGLWLGDGHSNTTALTTKDQEILDEWTKYADDINLNVRVDKYSNAGKAKTYHITSNNIGGKSKNHNSFMRDLRELELINNKHIPELYLRSSRQQRLDLLAGLLDTDGTLVSETFIITQKSDLISKGIVFLAESLGFRVTHKKIKIKTNFTQNNQDYYTNKISIGGNTDVIPTKIPNKKAQYKEKSRNWLNYGIEIECVGEGEYFGIVLKEEPHFVLGDFTVTHNTLAGKVNMAENLIQYGKVSPSDYMSVIQTGKLEAATDKTNSEMLLIRSENEGFLAGEPQIVVDLDDHALHINEHKALINDRTLRKNPELLRLVLEHINEHKVALQQVDPMLLQITGQQPIPPMNQPQGGNMAPQNPDQMPADQQALEGQGTGMQAINMPDGFEEVPITPEAGFNSAAGIPEE